MSKRNTVRENKRTGTPVSDSDLARIVVESYPNFDLCGIDPNVQSLEALQRSIQGDSLLAFIVTELREGVDGTLEDAIRLMTTARNDIQAVVDGLEAGAAARLRETCDNLTYDTPFGIALDGGVGDPEEW